MSKLDKAEQKAFEIYPVLMRYNDFQMVEEDINKPLREIYQEGYHQAEKDNELTWEDIRDICRMWVESKTPFGVTGEALSIEVLKRFKDLKERK